MRMKILQMLIVLLMFKLKLLEMYPSNQNVKLNYFNVTEIIPISSH